MKPRPAYSWLANKLLKIRGDAFKWVKLRVGNGLTCRFWSDNWSPFGRISCFLKDQRLGVRQDATLLQLHEHGRWALPNPRSDQQVSLHIFLTNLTLSDHADYYEWEVNGKIYQRYSTGLVYHLLHEDSPLVPWRTAVWTYGGIPKHSFFTWLLVLNRCPTRDRILGWGLQTDPACLLCNFSQESRDHLFFNCNLSWTVWSSIALRCQLQPLRSWSATVTQMQAIQGPKDKRRLSLLAWQCSMYFLWGERNNRLHRNTFRSADSLLRLIDSTVRNRISTFRDQNPRLSSSMLQLWFSSSWSSPGELSLFHRLPSPTV